VGLVDHAEVTDEGQKSRARNAHGGKSVAGAGDAVRPIRVGQDTLDPAVTLGDDDILLAPSLSAISYMLRRRSGVLSSSPTTWSTGPKPWNDAASTWMAAS
jgi:hypothetical protein